MNSMRRIVWAYDPYNRNRSIQRHAIQFISSLCRASQIEIYPVYVMTPDRINVPAELFYPQIQAYFSDADRVMKRRLRNVNLNCLANPEVVVKAIYTTAGATKALDIFARKKKADLIIVGSHARSGVSRFFMGSFAETLLYYASTPTIIVGPKAKNLHGLKHILFATELGERASRDFEKVLSFAEQYQCAVTLLHIIPEPTILLPSSDALETNKAIIEAMKKNAEQRLRALASAANKSSVKVKVQIQVDVTAQGVAERILGLARKNHAQMIALAPRRTRIAAAVLGSVARRVIRQADRPVWVLHEKKSSNLSATKDERQLGKEQDPFSITQADIEEQLFKHDWDRKKTAA